MAPWYDWDEHKARENQRKHGISFDEAATVFLDPLAGTLYDPDHSEDEERYITIGMTRRSRLVVVSHTYRQGDGIRIISVRSATAHERRMYERR